MCDRDTLCLQITVDNRGVTHPSSPVSLYWFDFPFAFSDCWWLNVAFFRSWAVINATWEQWTCMEMYPFALWPGGAGLWLGWCGGKLGVAHRCHEWAVHLNWLAIFLIMSAARTSHWLLGAPLRFSFGCFLVLVSTQERLAAAKCVKLEDMGKKGSWLPVLI